MQLLASSPGPQFWTDAERSHLLRLLICSLALLLLLQPLLQCCPDGFVLGQIERGLAIPVSRLNISMPLYEQLNHIEVPCIAELFNTAQASTPMHTGLSSRTVHPNQTRWRGCLLRAAQ